MRPSSVSHPCTYPHVRFIHPRGPCTSTPPLPNLPSPTSISFPATSTRFALPRQVLVIERTCFSVYLSLICQGIGHRSRETAGSLARGKRGRCHERCPPPPVTLDFCRVRNRALNLHFYSFFYLFLMSCRFYIMIICFDDYLLLIFYSGALFYMIYLPIYNFI